jgi:hypothetical protein
MGEKHTQARDKKVRKSEPDKYGRRVKSPHKLEMRRKEKVSKTNMGNWGKITHFLETRRREKMSNTNMGDGGKACTR